MITLSLKRNEQFGFILDSWNGRTGLLEGYIYISLYIVCKFTTLKKMVTPKVVTLNMPFSLPYFSNNHFFSFLPRKVSSEFRILL